MGYRVRSEYYLQKNEEFWAYIFGSLILFALISICATALLLSDPESFAPGSEFRPYSTPVCTNGECDGFF